MLDANSGKSRAQRIELDYFRRPSWGLRIKWIGSAIVAVICTAYAVAVVIRDGSNSHANTGPLALAHADLEEECAACHTPFQPLASDAFLADAPHHRQLARQKCEQCHPSPHATDTIPQAEISLASGSAAPRSADASVAPQPLAGFSVAGHFDAWLNPAGETHAGCVVCHREHQGRAHDLRVVANTACISCHGDLSLVTSDNQPRQVDEAVTAFAPDAHPEFWYRRDDATDPGTVRFDHHQHLLPGQISSDQRGGFHSDQLPPEARDRYGKDAEGLVQLSCTDCHARNDAVLGATDVEEGRTFAPIRFEEHCAACHELNYPTRDDSVQPVPHAVTWETAGRLLRGAIGGHLLERTGDDSPENAQLPKIPGTDVGAAEEQTVTVERLDQLVEQGLETLRSQCQVCHEPDALTSEAIQDALAGLRPEMIPQQWLRRGMFNHAAHAEVDCRRCHDAAYLTEGGGNARAAAGDHDQIMIRGIEGCVDCHSRTDSASALAAVGEQRGEATVQASAACTLCHRYHWTRPAPGDSSHSASAGQRETAYQTLAREVLQ